MERQNMTDKELHRMKRTDLLEILLEQRQEIESLSQDLETTQAKLQERKHALDSAKEVSEAVVALCSAFTAWSPSPGQESREGDNAEKLAAAMQLLQEKTEGLVPQSERATQDAPEAEPTVEIVAVSEQFIRNTPEPEPMAEAEPEPEPVAEAEPEPEPAAEREQEAPADTRAAYTFLPVRIAKKPASAANQPEQRKPAARPAALERQPEPAPQTIVLERKPEPTIQTIVLEPAPEAVSGGTRTVVAAAHPQTKPQLQTAVQNAAKPVVSGQSRSVYQTIKVRAKQITRNLLRKLAKQQRRRQKTLRTAIKRIRASRR